MPVVTHSNVVVMDKPKAVVNHAAVVSSFEKFIGDYGVLPRPDYALVVTLWALGTHCHLQFRAYGFLQFTSDMTGCGKTHMLELLNQIVHEGRLESKVTLAAMTTMIGKDHPTLLLDQAEKLSTRDNNELMATHLTGYKAGQRETIMKGGEVSERETYCPRAFALLGGMMEAARDRSIIITMRPAKPRLDVNEVDWSKRGERLRNLAAASIAERKNEIDEAVGNFKRLDFLNGRENEIWKPLFVVCGLYCPGRRIELERAAAAICAAKRAEVRKVSPAEANRRANDLQDGNRLMHDLLPMIGKDTGIWTHVALPKLLAIHNAPWQNYADEGLSDIKMAQLLAVYGVHPKQIKKGGVNQRGYLKADLLKALKAPASTPAYREPEPEPEPETLPQKAATPLPPIKRSALEKVLEKGVGFPMADEGRKP